MGNHREARAVLGAPSDPQGSQGVKGRSCRLKSKGGPPLKLQGPGSAIVVMVTGYQGRGLRREPLPRRDSSYSPWTIGLGDGVTGERRKRSKALLFHYPLTFT